MTYGPLTLAFDVYQNFYSYNAANDIYNVSSGSYLGGHAVKVVGWGNQNGMDYWLIANSWSTGWGNQGYFKIRMGVNLCGIENYPTSVYTLSQRKSMADEVVEERQSVSGDDVSISLPITPPGGMVTHLDLQSDFINNAANNAANLIQQLNSGRQAQAAPVVQSAHTAVAAGVNYDMIMELNGNIYHVLMFQDLQGTYFFTAPPEVVGTVAGAGGLTGGDIAAIVVCSVFGAALLVGAAVYAVTRNGEDSNHESEKEVAGEAGVMESPKGRFGIPVMNPFSHIRRVKEGKHQSVTARSGPAE